MLGPSMGPWTASLLEMTPESRAMGCGGAESSLAGSGTQDWDRRPQCSVSPDPGSLPGQDLPWARTTIPQCLFLTGTALWPHPYTLLPAVSTALLYQTDFSMTQVGEGPPLLCPSQQSRHSRGFQTTGLEICWS